MASSNFIVIYDACVLYPAPVRDLLLRVALEPPALFRPVWSEMIHQEWIRNLHDRDPVKFPFEKLRKLADLMNQTIPDSVVTEFEDLIEGLDLPDRDDRHVLAAAIKSSAQVIVTENLKDFPASKIAKYNIQAKSADKFLVDLLSLDDEKVYRALQKQQSSLANPPVTMPELLLTLENCGLKTTVAMLKLIINSSQENT